MGVVQGVDALGCLKPIEQRLPKLLLHLSINIYFIDGILKDFFRFCVVVGLVILDVPLARVLDRCVFDRASCASELASFALVPCAFW